MFESTDRDSNPRPDQAHQVGGRLGTFPHQLSWLIDNPLRRLIIAPKTLATRLPLHESDRILEIGPGSGYFSAALASQIPKGHLELVDVQPEMLAKAQRRLQAQGLSNIGYTVCDAGKESNRSNGATTCRRQNGRGCSACRGKRSNVASVAVSYAPNG